MMSQVWINGRNTNAIVAHPIQANLWPDLVGESCNAKTMMYVSTDFANELVFVTHWISACDAGHHSRRLIEMSLAVFEPSFQIPDDFSFTRLKFTR